MKKNVYFVSGIDTNIGKSYATAYLAKTWNERGIRTITEKLIQTGNTDMSEDIELHRRIMGTGLLSEDKERLTMPEIFSYPCSPHLAAEIDKRPIDFDKIERAYVAQKQYPLVFVTSGRLGSINHTLLSLEAMTRRGIRLHTLAYNLFPEEDDEIIRRDTEEYMRDLLKRQYPEAEFVVVPFLGTK